MARKAPTKRYGQLAEDALGIQKSDSLLIPPGMTGPKKQIESLLPKIDAAKVKNAELRRKRGKNAS